VVLWNIDNNTIETNGYEQKGGS
jgi:predicted RNA-binding protein YlqC (UPF0109 family)